MGDSLDFSFVQKERGLNQSFPVPRRTRVYDLYVLRQFIINVFDRADGSSERVSLIIMVEGIQEGSVFSYQSGFRRGGTGVDAEKSFSLIGCQVLDRDLMP